MTASDITGQKSESSRGRKRECNQKRPGVFASQEWKVVDLIGGSMNGSGGGLRFLSSVDNLSGNLWSSMFL